MMYDINSRIDAMHLCQRYPERTTSILKNFQTEDPVSSSPRSLNDLERAVQYRDYTNKIRGDMAAAKAVRDVAQSNPELLTKVGAHNLGQWARDDMEDNENENMVDAFLQMSKGEGDNIGTESNIEDDIEDPIYEPLVWDEDNDISDYNR